MLTPNFGLKGSEGVKSTVSSLSLKDYLDGVGDSLILTQNYMLIILRYYLFSFFMKIPHIERKTLVLVRRILVNGVVVPGSSSVRKYYC